MGQLFELALRLQQALDSPDGYLTDDAVPALGTALLDAMHRNADHTVCAEDVATLESIIMRTTLATSIVAHFERFPWTAVTARMMAAPRGTVLQGVLSCGAILEMLAHAAEAASQESKGTLAVLLLRQVHTPWQCLPV